MQAQEYFPKNDGVKTRNTNYTVFKNAKIHIDPENVIDKGMFAIREGKITAVGKSINIPKNSIVIDLKGKEVYPSFIDLYSDFGIQKPKRLKAQIIRNMMPAVKVITGMIILDLTPKLLRISTIDPKEAEKFQKAGFGVVNTHIPDGIVRGTGMLVAFNS